MMTDDTKTTSAAGDGSGKGLAAILPYYLHPSDNSGSVISPVQLKGENYEEWACSMRNSLRAKKKLLFIGRTTLNKPAQDSSDLEDWWMVNLMLVAWIFNTIEPSLRSTITYMKNMKDMWEELH